jgi:hypothetical protein
MDEVETDDVAADDAAPRRGIFIGLSAGAGGAGGALSGGLAAMDAVFNPGAARAREELEQQHERVVPAPSPGDRMLDEGVVVIDAPD